jgi:hypothetical protein
MWRIGEFDWAGVGTTIVVSLFYDLADGRHSPCGSEKEHGNVVSRRAPSTICREVRRKGVPSNHQAKASDQAAWGRAH